MAAGEKGEKDFMKPVPNSLQSHFINLILIFCIGSNFKNPDLVHAQSERLNSNYLCPHFQNIPFSTVYMKISSLAENLTDEIYFNLCLFCDYNFSFGLRSKILCAEQNIGTDMR